MRNFTDFDPSTQKFLCFNWLLVTKIYNVWATKVQRSYLSWHWRVMHILKKNWLVVWNRQFGKFSSEHLKVSKLGLWWDPFVQNRKGMTLKFTEELSVWQWKIMQNLNRNWLVISKLTWRPSYKSKPILTDV